MRLWRWACLLPVLAPALAQQPRRDYDQNNHFAVHLASSLNPIEAAARLGATYEGPVGELTDHYIFSCPKHFCDDLEHTLDDLNELRKRRQRRRRSSSLGEYTRKSKRNLSELEGIRWSEKQQLRQRLVKRIPPEPLSERQASTEPQPDDGDGDSDEDQQEAIERLNTIAKDLDIQDPIFKEQWHLFNPLQLGHDLNVTGVWLEGITGNGTISAVIDDGLDMYSDDLKDNYYKEGSWDFNEQTDEPKPRLYDDKHGTRCAGEIAAVRNNVCGVGMAYDSKIAGIRILSKPISDEDEASAINYHYQDNDIYSCSWGPPDDGQTMDAPGLLIQRAMVNGIQNGRNGLGSVFVFAAGNGASADDNCNFDGYTNSIYSITVGGIDRAGNHPYYSESCSAQMVVTYSSGHNDAIHTTDVGTDKCYNGHGGTSAAGPLVVGTVALALSARPDLSWRDLQYLCIETAIPIHLDDGDWQDTPIGKKFSHMYGYGKVDAYQYVQAAKDWETVKPQAWYNSPWLSVQHDVPQGDQGLAASFDVTNEMLAEANFERLEHITVTMNVEHTRRGDLSVELRGPQGIVSHLSTPRRNDAANVGYDDWTFMSVAHWGEKPNGTWTVIVKDTNVNEHNGTFIDWRLNLWGESINADIQALHPMPDEHDDDHETASAIVTTTSIDPGSTPTAAPSVPTDHIDRPTRPKPSGDTETTVIATTTDAAPGTTVSQSGQATHTYSDSFLPSFFPTFGVSKKTQIWIYGAAGLIVLFCVGLGIYSIVQRRKRLRNTRNGYEFEMVGTEEDDEARRGLNSGRGGARRPRRGGDLYDAFAGGSDEELYSEDEQYQDTPDTSGGSNGSDENRPGAIAGH